MSRMNTKSVASSVLTLAGWLRPLYYSCAAPHGCLWRLNDANTSRQGRLDHVTACRTTVSTDTGRHRYHLPLRKSSVWTYFFGRYPICEENCCSAWRHSAQDVLV